MSERKIQILREGQLYGPYPEGSARDMLAAGQLLAEDLAWYEGAAEWKPLTQVLEPTPQAAQATPPPPPKPAAASAAKRQLTEAKKQEGEGNSDLIHITRKGKAIGPYSRMRAKYYFAVGTLLPSDRGWHEGMGEDWKPLNEVLGLLAEEAGSSKYNPGQTKKRADSLVKQGLSDRAKLQMLLIFCALNGILVGFVFGDKNLGTMVEKILDQKKHQLS